MSKLIVRAGDMLRVGDDLRAALAVAETAISLAEQHGASTTEARRLRDLVRAIRGG